MKLLSAGPVTRLTFSPDSRLLLAEKSQETLYDSVALWDAAAGVVRYRYGYPCRWAFLVGDAILGVDASRTFIRLVPPNELAERPNLQRAATSGPASPTALLVRRLLLSPDGTRLVGLNWWTRGVPALYWWTWPDLTPLPTGPGTDAGQLAAAAFAPDGSFFALETEGDLTAYGPEAGPRWRTALRLAEERGSITCCPAGRFIAVATGTRLTVVDAAESRTVHEVRQPRKHVLGVAFTPDGRFLATVSNEETVKFLDTSSWMLRHELAWQVGGLRAIAFSPDGMLAAAGGSGKKVVVWDMDL